MRRRCGPGRDQPGGAKLAGMVMMVAGALMFLIFVPRWVWTGALGIVLISTGFLLWRFG